MQRPLVGRNFELGGLRDHMQPHIQVGGGVMWIDRPKEKGRDP